MTFNELKRKLQLILNSNPEGHNQYTTHQDATSAFEAVEGKAKFKSPEETAAKASGYASRASLRAQQEEETYAGREHKTDRGTADLKRFHQDAYEAHKSALKVQKRIGASQDILDYHKESADEHSERHTNLGGLPMIKRAKSSGGGLRGASGMHGRIKYHT